MDNINPNPLVYTIPELAKKLKISTSTAYTLARAKNFPIINIGKRKLVPARELEIWLREHCNGI